MAPSRRQLILKLLGLVAYARLPKLSAAGPFPPAQKRRFSVPLVDDLGQVVSRYDATALYFVEELGNGVTLEMALIPGGSFDMGSIFHVPIPPSNIREQPVHRVSAKSFSLGVFAVTIGQWRQVSTFPQVTRALHVITRGNVPLDIENRLPADFISYPETDEFCTRLQRFTGRPYRLPTEAEWEYACRSGTATKYHFGDGISLQVANYNEGHRPLALTHVGSKQAPNRFGLHDMHGNVLERCMDWDHATYDGAPTDGSAWTYGSDPLSRIGRGGQYLLNADIARSATRFPSDVREIDPNISIIANAASGVVGSLVPGEIVTIRGTNIGPNTPASAALDERGLVATELSGTRVLFDGVPAPLLYVSADQVNAIVPYAIGGRSSTQIILENQGQSALPASVPVVAASPALFTADSSGQGQAAAANQDGSLNAANNPAQKGSIMTFYATGEGQTNPPGVDGKPASSPLPAPVLGAQLLIGGVAAGIQYVGAAPGEVAGVLQINARIPMNIPIGRQPVLLRIGEFDSPDGVFIAVG